MTTVSLGLLALMLLIDARRAARVSSSGELVTLDDANDRKAAGANTYKLKYGHRGQNQPCLESGSKRCYITSQNHGYAVDTDSLPGSAKLTHLNLNDGTCEGFLDADTGLYRGRPVDVAVMKDGSLLISDDFAGAIYRVTYTAP